MPNGTAVTPEVLPLSPTAGVVSYTIVGFATLLVYDILLCLPDEVTLVWSRARNPRSWIYFLNRYIPLVDTFISLRLLTTIQPPDVCERDFQVVTWMIVVGVFIAESILMLRTYAIFERKRWMLIFLFTLLAGIAIPSFVVVKLELDTVHYGFPQRGPYQGCLLVDDTSVIIIVAYLLVLFSETVILSLTLFKAVKDLRHCRSPLVVNLYRNGMLYYAYTLIISLANVLVPIFGPPELDNWLATPQRVLHSIFCARILLSILRDGNLNATDTSNISGTATGSSMGFRKPNHPPAGITRGTVFSSVEYVIDDVTLAPRDGDVHEISDGPEEVEMSHLANDTGLKDDAIKERDLEAGVPVASSSRMKLEDELIMAEPRMPPSEFGDCHHRIYQPTTQMGIVENLYDHT